MHFVDLAPLADPPAVLPAIARALGAIEVSGRSPAAAICDLLRDHRALVVLDNVEHLLAEVAVLVADLLAHCRGLHILATSREPLHISWEHELLAPPLALPDARLLQPVQELATVASVALFVLRARSVDPTFVLSASNARAIAEICARLDGLPLAIELAAARLKHFTPTDLAARLEERLVLLVDGPRDAPRRQRTLRDALTWSYDLLAPDEQRLFRALSVCVGGADPATIANQWTAIGGAGDPFAHARSHASSREVLPSHNCGRSVASPVSRPRPSLAPVGPRSSPLTCSRSPIASSPGSSNPNRKGVSNASDEST
jgi:predicted ATPase